MSRTLRYRTLTVPNVVLATSIMGISDTAAAFSLRDSLFARAESSKLPGGAQKDQGIGIVSFLTAVSDPQLLSLANLAISKPKTYLVPRCEQTDSPNGGLIQLLRGLWNVSDQELIRKCGLDAYLFLRYLKTLLVIFIPIAGVVIPVLVPLNYVDGRGRQLNSDGQSNTHLDLAPVTGLDTLAWGNVKASNTNRYWAHLAMSVLVVAWVCFVFFLEMRVYIKVRQNHLTSADHRLKPSTATILVSSIPEKLRTEQTLRDLFRMFPDGVKKVWVNRDLSSLLRKIAHRDAVHRRLEAAETDLIKSVHKAQYKQGKTAETGPRKNPGLDTMNRQDQTSCDGRNGQKSQRQMVRMKKADGSERNGVYLQSHPGTACFVRGTHRSAAQEGSAKIASKARCSNGVSIPNQEIKSSEHIATEETHLAEISQAVRAASKAGIRMEKMAARTNGFSPLAQAYVNDCSEEHSWIEQDQSVLNTSQNPMIENLEKESGPSRVLYVAKWWQFWKPPYGSSATPVSQTKSSGHDRGNACLSRNPSSIKVTTDSNISLWRFMGKLPRVLGLSGQNPVGRFEYTEACSHELEKNWEGKWQKYLGENDRPTHRLPLFGIWWLPGIAPFTRKVDTISWCRRELARLNMEIEEDQKHEKLFPLLDSAFIQFNSQIAAHMACQSTIHHLPERMTSRIVGICPKDILWANMAVTFWGRRLRTVTTSGLLFLMISLWSIPVAWTGALSQVDQLIQGYEWFSFVEKREGLRRVVQAFSGLLPASLLAGFLFLLPLFLDSLADFKGAKSHSMKSEFVQKFYFAFLFIQVFLVVSIASFFTSSVGELATNMKELQKASDVLDILARNLPKAANYFFSYMILQSLSTSSATLLQVGSLITWYIIAPALDSTPRDKWSRNTTLNSVKWGAVFPVYTNFACIALIYCIISPLISVFAIITFGLLWLAQRYATIYVYRFDHDTGGVLYPRAINQTLTGLYVMELCIAGLFFIVKDEAGRPACTAHGVIMVLLLILTALYQVYLNKAFEPLFRFLPISLRDEANEAVCQHEMLRGYGIDNSLSNPMGNVSITNHSQETGANSRLKMGRKASQSMASSLFGGLPSGLEEVPQHQRDKLIYTAFQHGALRARRPVVWIPKDSLGISDDEIRQTRRYTKHIPISNHGAFLDSKGHVSYERNPPDFSKLDLVKL